MLPEQIAINNIPDTSTVYDHLSRRFGLAQAIRPFLGRTTALHRFKLAVASHDQLAEACRVVIQRFGLRGFRNTADDNPNPAYGSLSLTCGPGAQHDPHSATLGSDRLQGDDYYLATPETMARLPRQKGGYHDSYSFTQLTPAAEHGALGDLMRGFRLSLIRSRLSVIAANRIEATKPEFGWHRDETVFHNLRINIPIWTAPEFLLEIETARDRHVENSETVLRRHLACGHAWSWDTYRPHRVFAAQVTDASRCHLVIGLAPWFDYDPVQRSWTPNRYFGRVHPFDLIADGLAHPAIRGGARL